MPIVFDTDGDGAEFCCLTNDLLVGWDRRRHMVLTNTLSGYVDRCPFHSLDDICLLTTYLAG